MKKFKKVISCMLAAALVLAAVPFSAVETSAASPTNIYADASLVLNRPQASVIVTEVTRVAYQANSMMAPSGNNSVIVKSTPSGIPYLGTNRSNTIGYAGETPVATTVVFTPGVVLDETPTLVCGNSTVTWSAPVFSNGTYTWTVTGGTAMAGSTLVFTVNYVYSEVNNVTGKTYTYSYSTGGTSYVEPIATPAGLFSTKRTYSNWGLGTTTQNRSYLSSFILGKNAYGSLYNNGTGDGSVAFATTAWANGASWTDQYGVMQSMSGSDASRDYNVAFKVDDNRPVTTVYYDTSINSTLSDLNLRTVSMVMNQSDESDEIVTVTMKNIFVLDGNVATAENSDDELDITSDETCANQLGITVPTTSLYALASNFTSYFTGSGPAAGSGTKDYTVVFQYQTAAGWSDVRVSHSYDVRIVTYDKGALRTLVENVQSTDPSVKITELPDGDYKGYNPQSWYYASGYESFASALNSARSCLDKPNVTQQEIDTAYNTLSSAYDALELRTADYTMATVCYNQAMNKNPDNYTLASWAKLQTLLDSYRDDYSILYQPAVDKMTADIKAAMDSLEERNADYSGVMANLITVNNLIAQAQFDYGKSPERVYTGWDNLVSVLSKSGCAYNELDGYTVEDYLPISEQAKVDGYVLLIERAINAIGMNTADYTNASKAEAAYRVIKTAQVVPEIASELTAAYNALTALHNLDITHQAEIDAATANLNYWLGAIEYRPADTTAAEAKIAYAYSLDRSLYSDFSGVDAAIENLLSKFSLDIRYQNEINSATNALQSAIDRLNANSADYSLVDEALEAVAECERLILETYEDTYGYTAATFYSNWSNVTSAVNSVIRGLDLTKQTQVDGYADTINSALAALTENGADYTQVTALRNQAHSICLNGGNLYTEQSLNTLLDLYTSVETGLPISRQPEVDSYAAELQTAMDNLEYLSANYGTVNTQISNANAKIAADEAYAAAHPGYTLYTAESMAELDVALAAVVDGRDIRYQSEVNAYADDISTAISNLKYAPADYSLVEAALANVPADTSIYTTVSLATLNTYINSVNYSYTADKQSTVDKYVTNINNAISKLKLKAANYSAVNSALALVPQDASVYTEDSWQALQAQVNAVVTGYDITKQSEVDAMAENINNAISLLAFKGADYSAVEAAKLTVPSDLSVYTDESAAALNEVLNSIDYYCNITQQSTVDGYASAITSAVAGLEEKGADYSTVADAVSAANEKIDSGLYTDESTAAVQTKISAVEYGLGITHQNEVYAMAEAINTAADAMIYRDAEYSDLNSAVAAAEEKISTGFYTDASVALLQAEIDKITYNLDITHQNDVDCRTESIVKATKDLKLKLADYTELQNILNLLDNSASEIYTITYTNFNEVMSIIDDYRENCVKMDVTADRQSEVDGMVSALQGYIDSLEPYAAPDESYEFVGTAFADDEYAYGFRTNLTKSQFAEFVECENTYYELEASSSRYVGTGSVVRFYSETTDELLAEYVIVIYGDVDGNGKIDNNDYSALKLSLSGEASSLAGAYKLAANVYGPRATVNMDDANAIGDVVAGLATVDQATGKIAED